MKNRKAHFLYLSNITEEPVNDHRSSAQVLSSCCHEAPEARRKPMTGLLDEHDFSRLVVIDEVLGRTWTGRVIRNNHLRAGKRQVRAFTEGH